MVKGKLKDDVVAVHCPEVSKVQKSVTCNSNQIGKLLLHFKGESYSCTKLMLGDLDLNIFFYAAENLEN